ncbi:MAG: Glycosyl transferase, family 2 [Parcubacteria group bacterium Gr01-1014_44]|nr:MAG: Glycosyl transferase, family 2 [Parcubacteria group bacterium Gr01-1014_44]
MSTPLVTINLVVLNGKKYVRHCLKAVQEQTYQNLEVNVFDNGSTDGTKEIIQNWKLEIGNWKLINFIESKINLGTWPGQEKAMESSRGKYIVALSVDVLMEPTAIEKAVVVLEKDESIGALEAKILQYTIEAKPQFEEGEIVKTNLIDTIGFQIFRSRRITNLGHGEEDRGQYNQEKEIFAVEGAAPVLRKSALEEMRVLGEIADREMFWYGDDLDLAWRMRLFGWKQVYSPEVVMYHDRSTTKGVSRGWKDYLFRVGDRKKIPTLKKRLDWRNKRLARIKNDHWQNALKDLWPIAWRELRELGYIALFEPAVLLEIPKLIRLLPRTLKKRKVIMARAKVGPKEMSKWFL